MPTARLWDQVRCCWGSQPLPAGGGPAAYLALAMHSKVVSLDPATTLLLLGGTTMMGAMASGVPASPVAEKAEAMNGASGVQMGRGRECDVRVGHGQDLVEPLRQDSQHLRTQPSSKEPSLGSWSGLFLTVGAGVGAHSP